MTQKDKNLLLKDLCARLSYGVFINTTKGDGTLDTIQVYRNNYVICSSEKGHEIIDYVKPYLRSMSSMTKEEFKEYLSMLIDVGNSGLMNQGLITKIVDWLDKKMFDHRNLVPKGLALEAPEDMYKTE